MLGLAHRRFGRIARLNAIAVVFRVIPSFRLLVLGAPKLPLRSSPVMTATITLTRTLTRTHTHTHIHTLSLTLTHIHTEAPSAPVTNEYCCRVVADRRDGSTAELVMWHGGRESGANSEYQTARWERASQEDLWRFFVKFPGSSSGAERSHYGRTTQRRWMLRAPPRSSTGIEMCVVMYRWAPCLPRSRKREKKRSAAGEQQAQNKMCVFYVDLFT